jgi:hypothetical protein
LRRRLARSEAERVKKDDNVAISRPSKKARSVSFGRAAMRLAKLAFYDEALSIVRSIGEIANLLALFAPDKVALEEWKRGLGSTDRITFHR